MRRHTMRVETYYKASGAKCWKAYFKGGELDGLGCSCVPGETREDAIREAFGCTDGIATPENTKIID